MKTHDLVTHRLNLGIELERNRWVELGAAARSYTGPMPGVLNGDGVIATIDKRSNCLVVTVNDELVADSMGYGKHKDAVVKKAKVSKQKRVQLNLRVDPEVVEWLRRHSPNGKPTTFGTRILEAHVAVAKGVA